MELKTLRQKVKGLFEGGEDRGVSPVIGVILMVAITVILAAVIGAFVLGLGDDLESSAAPTASVDVYETNGNEDVTIEHRQGDSIATEELRVVIRGDNTYRLDYEDLVDDTSIEIKANDEFAIGDTIVISQGATIGENTVTHSTPYDIELVHQPSGTQLGSGSVNLSDPSAA